MIRIDEIYNNTFWPWIEKHLPKSRMFFCDPPGKSDPESLYNFGHDSPDNDENEFVFLHDQEPVHLDLHRPLFDSVVEKNLDLLGTPQKHVIVSEKGEFVEELCRIYGWKSHYYFYHGWASRDWYRGYNHSFIINRAADRTPSTTFISPNRIVAGKRDHRVLFLYNIFCNGLAHNHISAPRVCPYENVDISIIAQKYNNIYTDIEQVFREADLPRHFRGEDTQIMSSYCLGNFLEAEDSLIYVPTETVYFGRRTHLTEKTFKAIALEMPFVLVAPAHSLEYLRSYGFRTFSDIFDESYDEETDDIVRIEKVTKLLKDLDSLSVAERQQIHQACLPIVEHNYAHFYQGDFDKVLWQELKSMLNELCS